MNQEIKSLYGNKVRVRACGICLHEGRLLMVNHLGLHDHDFWAPPGGGVEFGQSVGETTIREFREETGLDVGIEEYLFSCELIRPELHAVELFYTVRYQGGIIVVGTDPETRVQLIRDVRWLSEHDVFNLPPKEVHGIFTKCRSFDELQNLRGLIVI